jgi:osmotically-inducible protein OsmY
VPKRQAGGTQLGDAELEKAIREHFARSKIAADGFSVRVQGGVATLEGRTNVVQHKGTATRLAKAAGARKVINRIEVSEQARLKASQNLAQGRRRAQIKRSESNPRSEPR